MDPYFEKQIPDGRAESGSLDLDELLRHKSVLHSLVRRIIADEQGVEDVLQETWIKALERPPGPIDSLRSWLSCVARNLALNRVRGERRAVERERRSARPDTIGTTTLDTAQKLERQSQVLAAVMRVDEPRRTAIHMRYFEGKQPAAIAIATGVSVHTVNDRLRAGRRELRRDLERALDIRVDDRGFMGLYLLPLAGLSEHAAQALRTQLAATAAAGALATTTFAPPTVLGGLLMSKKVLVVGVIALAAVGIRWSVGGTRGPAQSDAVRPAVAAAPASPRERAPVEAQLAPVETAAEARSAKREAVAAALKIHGTVRDRDDVAVANVRLLARIWNGYKIDGTADVEATLISDADGRFQWNPERPEGGFVVQVQPADEDFEGYSDEEVVTATETPRSFEVRVHPLDVVVTGFVRDIAGNPIANARVKSGTETTTDETGAYVLPASTQALGMIYASAPGYAGRREVIELSPVGDTRLDFVLLREFRIFGRITDERGRPVAGVGVATFFSQGKGNVATSDADGRYELGGLEPGRENHNLYARMEGFAETAVTVKTVPEMRFEQDLVMRLGTRVEGRVQDEQGRALAGASVYIGFSPDAYDRLDAVSDDEGVFVFPNVKHGKQTIGTHVDEFAPDVRDFELSEGLGLFDQLEIVLFEGRTVEGVVTGPDGEPVEGVLAHMRYKSDWIEAQSETDTEGHFVLNGVPPTDIELSLYKPGFARFREEIADGDVRLLELVLALSGKVAGHVVDGVTGEPVSRFTIRLLQPDCPDGKRAGMSSTWAREGHSFSKRGRLLGHGRRHLRTGQHGQDRGDRTGLRGGSEGLRSGRRGPGRRRERDRALCRKPRHRACGRSSRYPAGRRRGEAQQDLSDQPPGSTRRTHRAHGHER